MQSRAKLRGVANTPEESERMCESAESQKCEKTKSTKQAKGIKLPTSRRWILNSRLGMVDN